MARIKILVVHHDLDTLSKIYLALVHRNYKTEASDKVEEIEERIKRLKPALIILGKKEWLSLKDILKMRVIIILEKPFQMEVLIRTIEEQVI